MCNFREKWEINLTIWHTVPRFNLRLFTSLTKSEVSFQHLSTFNKANKASLLLTLNKFRTCVVQKSVLLILMFFSSTRFWFVWQGAIGGYLKAISPKLFAVIGVLGLVRLVLLYIWAKTPNKFQWKQGLWRTTKTTFETCSYSRISHWKLLRYSIYACFKIFPHTIILIHKTGLFS